MDEGQNKVIRAPSLKRGKNIERISNRIKLEKVLGVTVASNASLASDNEGRIAYPAGCTVVLFNTKTEQQHHIINSSRKTITSLAFSSCGRYLVTGECGHQPSVRVWDLLSDPQSTSAGLPPQPQQIAEFLGHTYGVNCVSFSPSGRFVVSVGTQHDMIVNVWDWKNNIKVASNKVSTKVKAVAFADNGSYFVTVGNRHVKFWYLEYGKSKYKEAVPLMGRSAILGEQRNNYFCDVACGKSSQCGDSTYAITRSGLLCEFNNRRLLDKWVELRTTSANCITVGEKYIFVGCADAIIRCFDPSTLSFITTLPRTHYLGVDVSLGSNIKHMASVPQGAKYPDTVAVTYNETTNKLTCIYNDHSIYVWDIFNIKKVGKSHSFLYHSACIWGVDMAPPTGPLPPGSFLTCGSDDTIRVWSLDKVQSRGVYRQNIYSNELLKVVYVDKELSYIKDMGLSTSSTTNGGTSSDKQSNETSSYDGRNGVRCIRLSPDGRHLASGDRSGNIRIHDTESMKELIKIEAHDSEVLCLEYSDSSDISLMASASRDRLLHVFNVQDGYEFMQTLDDHSSSITAVRFLSQGHGNNMQMVSCGADKSLIFRSLGELGGVAQFTREHNTMGKTTLYDMEVDSGQKHVLTACQDRNVRIYSVNTGKHTKSFKGSTGDDGTLVKVVLDRSGIYLATSCTDKSLSVYDYYSGECMATMCGHSELVTGLRFTQDCRRLISASGDGCIFVWTVPHDMVVTMHARLSQQAIRQGKTLDIVTLTETIEQFDNNTATPQRQIKQVDDDDKYRFSIGQLPKWAKKQLNDDGGGGGGGGSALGSVGKSVAAPKGRWAQRAEQNHLEDFYSDFSPPRGSLSAKFHDSDGGSKDSSLEFRRPGTTSDTAHDGDVDSDIDYTQRPLYYPSQSESPTHEYTITNMDADELRKSQRKKKLPQISITATPPPAAVVPGDFSDEDEDELSTPSGENTDRNPLSLFSGSAESLDQLETREKYLQSTFESMGGGDSALTAVSTAKKSTISSKFLTRSSDINAAAINAVKQTKSDPETAKKRLLLNKRIAETKKKLESVGHTSPLKYSQSIHDLSHIPERDRYSSKKEEVDRRCVCPPTSSGPQQLCRCYAKDIANNTTSTQLSQIFGIDTSNRVVGNHRKRSRVNKSLPVSPSSGQDFLTVCSDIQQFSKRCSKRYDRINTEEGGNFSSDSLEDEEEVELAPRRCVSSNELCQFSYSDPDLLDSPARSESFFLNPNNLKSSQDSILSSSENLLDDDSFYRNRNNKSNCSLESMLSNDSDYYNNCKSAPLEILFRHPQRPICHSQSLPKNLYCDTFAYVPRKKSIETQTDPPVIVVASNKKVKPKELSADFKAKLSKFECVNYKKPPTLFSETPSAPLGDPRLKSSKTGDIPTLDSKNEQYRRQYCNVLNNSAPKFDCTKMFSQSGGTTTTTTTTKNPLFEKNTNNRNDNKKTSSLDRHLFMAKSLIDEGGERIYHKPPKAVRHNSSKSRKKTTTYEYVKKEDFYSNSNRSKSNLNENTTIELSYTECQDQMLDTGNDKLLLSKVYDTLDKKCAKSGGLNLTVVDESWGPKVFALDNIKILNEIQRKIVKINDLMEIFKRNMSETKVRALSNFYESMVSSSQSYHNDLKSCEVVKFRRRNLSLPCFVERRLSGKNGGGHQATYLDEGGNPEGSLRRSCSLSDLSMQKSGNAPKGRADQASARKSSTATTNNSARPNSRYAKSSGVSSASSISRSRSIGGGLNQQSDSENESERRVSRLMRPTISSYNKVNSGSTTNLTKGGGGGGQSSQLRKKQQSYSTSNINMVGVDGEMSSSEGEAEAPPTKPAVPPRSRATYERGGAGGGVARRQHLNNGSGGSKEKKGRGGKSDLDVTLTNESQDFVTSDISQELCDSVIDQLTDAAQKVVGLYNRLNNTVVGNSDSDGGGGVAKDDATPPGAASKQLKTLEMSILNTHKVLHECIFQKLKQSNDKNVDLNQTDTMKKLNDLVSKGATSPNSVVKVMEQYSDILLDMVQNRIHNNAI